MHSCAFERLRTPPLTYRSGMIIEAGYDILQLFSPKIFKRRAHHRRGMWVLALDENLRNLYLAKVGGKQRDVETRLHAIAKALDGRGLSPVAYWAAAVVDTGYSGDLHAEFEHIETTLSEAALLAEHHYLGCYFSNGKELYSSTPRYSFRDYPAMSYFPRAASCAGPHSFDCACLACTQFEERLRRNRERNDAAAEE